MKRKDEIGSTSFARGYRLVPLADDDTPIRPEWVRFWTEPAEYDYRVLSVDPAVSTGQERTPARWWCWATPPQPLPGERGFVSPLPRGGGRGVGSDRNEIHVLEATARRVTAPNLVALIDDCDRRWNPDVILFESNAAFLGIKDLLVRHARFGPRVKGVTQSSDKGARVAGFSVAVENGSVRLKGDGAGSMRVSGTCSTR